MDINDFDGGANNGIYNFYRKLIPWKKRAERRALRIKIIIQVFRLF